MQEREGQDLGGKMGIKHGRILGVVSCRWKSCTQSLWDPIQEIPGLCDSKRTAKYRLDTLRDEINFNHNNFKN